MNKEIVISNADDFYKFFVKKCNFENKKIGMYERYYVSPEFGEGSLEQIRFKNGLELCITDLNLKKSIELQYNLIDPPYEVNYILEGNLFHNELKAKDMNLSSGSISVYFRKEMCGITKFISGRNIKYITIIADKRFIEESLLNNEYHKELNDFKMSSRAIELTKPHRPRSELKSIFLKMKDCDFSSIGKLMYLQSKAIEALSFVWEKEIKLLESKNNILFLDKQAVESIEKARQLIEENMVEPYTIDKISKEVNMNAYKLKKGFKQVYNMTIFGYLKHIRMIKAKELLEKKELNIGEVCSAVGYTNASHFAKNFKEVYGETPKYFRFGA